MSSRKLQYLFENLIEQQLNSMNYLAIKNEMGEKYYQRDINGGNERIVFLFGHYGKMLSIKAVIGMYFNKIGDIYRRNTQVKERPQKCIGNHLLEIERFVNNGETTGRVYSNYRWKLRNSNQVYELSELFDKYNHDVIRPYFDQNNTIARVDELLNETPSISSIHNNLNPFRACIAIIAAKLNENPNFDELLSIYDETIKRGEKSYQTDYQKIRKHLLTGC